jgi:hypothetical protein
MFARWYLILFIIFLILILIVSVYNIYENVRIKRKCPKECYESQDILIWLNAIVIGLILILLIGYIFSGERSQSVPQMYPANRSFAVPTQMMPNRPSTITAYVTQDGCMNPYQTMRNGIDIIPKL